MGLCQGCRRPVDRVPVEPMRYRPANERGTNEVLGHRSCVGGMGSCSHRAIALQPHRVSTRLSCACPCLPASPRSAPSS